MPALLQFYYLVVRSSIWCARLPGQLHLSSSSRIASHSAALYAPFIGDARHAGAEFRAYAPANEANAIAL